MKFKEYQENRFLNNLKKNDNITTSLNYICKITNYVE